MNRGLRLVRTRPTQHVCNETGDNAVDYFGACPVCGRSDGYLNVYCEHWFVCHAHQRKWEVKAGTFPTWEREDAGVWRANQELLMTYLSVVPIYPMRLLPCDVAAAIARVLWELHDATIDRENIAADENTLIQASDASQAVSDWLHHRGSRRD